MSPSVDQKVGAVRLLCYSRFKPINLINLAFCAIS